MHFIVAMVKLQGRAQWWSVFDTGASRHVNISTSFYDPIGYWLNTEKIYIMDLYYLSPFCISNIFLLHNFTSVFQVILLLPTKKS